MENFLKIIIAIIVFTILELVYKYTFNLDSKRQLALGATLNADGEATALLVAQRKDFLARAAALSYMLIVYSSFSYFKDNISTGYRVVTSLGALFGLILFIIILVFRDYFNASDFDRPFYGGKIFLFLTRLIAYLFTTLSFLKW